MTLTTLLLSEWFAKFNHLYFDDTLPTPLFRLSKARTRFGYMKCVTSRKSWFSKPQRTFTIYISTYYDCSERDYQTVLLHEMIHYLICFLRLEDTSPHGVLFKKKADQINRCGWNITVSTSASHLKVSEQTRNVSADAVCSCSSPQTKGSVSSLPWLPSMPSRSITT